MTLILSAATGCGSSSPTSSSQDGGLVKSPTGDASGGADVMDAGTRTRGEGGAVHEASVDAPGHHEGAVVSDAASGSKDAAPTHDAAPRLGDGGDPALALGSCVGTAEPLLVAYQTPYVDVAVGSQMGEFAIDFGSTFSSIDLSAFTSPGPTTSGCDPTQLGVTCTVDAFAFFGPPASVSLVTESFAGLGGSVRQAGIIGTDFLSEEVFLLDYAGSRAYAASQATACSPSALMGAGYVALSTGGFYENDLSLLEPFTTVDSQASSGESVPNVPTVPVTIAGVSAVAQLDTGFDDGVTPFSVNVNKAFYQAIVAAHPGALVRDAEADESLSTCVSGVSEPVEAYTLASGTTFDFVASVGGSARSYAQAVLFVKETPASAQSCGGIGTWTAPAAQVGASFYVDMKSIVFDPFAARVWVPRP